MPLEISRGEQDKLQHLTWFMFFGGPEGEGGGAVRINLPIIERELVQFQLKPENVRILHEPVIDCFLRMISIVLRDGRRSLRISDWFVKSLYLFVLNHTSAVTYLDTFSMHTITTHFPPVQQTDMLNLIKEAHSRRKKILQYTKQWLYKNVLGSYDLLELCESYYAWPTDSKITLRIL